GPNTLRTLSLQSPTLSDVIPDALSPGQGLPRFAVTPNDGLVFVQIGPGMQPVQNLRWLAPGTTALTPPHFVTMGNALTRVAPLSDSAAIIVSQNDTGLWTSVEMRP
ncbi:MAG TPA: hypothetical protein VGG33_23495, partial [Polyangia bacterium]